MPWRITMHFKVEEYGWSEAWLDTQSSDIGSAKARAIELAKARLKICASNTLLKALKVSLEARPSTPLTTGDGESVDLSPLHGIGGPVSALDAVKVPSTWISDHPNVSLMVECGVTDSRHRKKVFFAGLPDALFVTNPIRANYEAVSPPWLAHFNLLKKFLTGQGWGAWFRHLSGGLAEHQPVVGIIQSTTAPGYWGIVTTTEGPALPVNTRVQLRGFKHRPWASRRWQGQWYIDSVATAAGPPATRTYFLRHSQLLEPGGVLNYGTIEGVLYAALPVNSLSNPKVVTRKRGVGASPPRGRSRRRLNLGAF